MLPARVAVLRGAAGGLPLDRVCRRVHSSQRKSRPRRGSALGICAVLLAEACNISLAEVTNLGVPALSPNRLSWVRGRYRVRAETGVSARTREVHAIRSGPSDRGKWASAVHGCSTDA